MSDENTPLLCAWCGKPVPAVGCVICKTDKGRINWHWLCADEDYVSPMPWEERARIVRKRGPDRVGQVKQEPKRSQE